MAATQVVQIVAGGLLVLFVCGVIAALVRYALRRRVATPAEAVCGQCGYNVRDLPTFICPECGRDLRTVGIIGPWQRRPLRPLVRAVLWTLALPIPAAMISAGLLATVIPTSSTLSDGLRFGAPKSGAYRELRLHVSGTRLRWPWEAGAAGSLRPDSVTIWCSKDGASLAPLEIALQTMGFRWQRADGDTVERSTGFDYRALGDWLAEAGVSPDDPWVRTEMGTVLAAVQMARTGVLRSVEAEGFGYRSQSTGHSSSRAASEAGLTAFWILVWLVGLWFCTRRRRAPLAQ